MAAFCLVLILGVFLLFGCAPSSEVLPGDNQAAPVAASNPEPLIARSANASASSLKIVSGNRQRMPLATFYPKPLIVRLTDGLGGPVVGAPIKFRRTGKLGGGVSLFYGGEVLPSLIVNTDANGCAEVYCAGVLSAGKSGFIKVTAGGLLRTFKESTEPYDPTIADMTDVKATPGAGNGEINMTWVNHATNATFILALKSTDGIYWTVVTRLNDPQTSSYIATGLDSAFSYHMSVIAGNCDLP